MEAIDLIGVVVSAELFPDSEVPARARAAGAHGRNQWFHGFLYFRRNRERWDTGATRSPRIAVNAQPERAAQLVLRVDGGGTARYPANSLAADPRLNRTVNDRMIVGGRLRPRHWYNIVLHIVWDYRARHGLVQRWLDGHLVFSRHRSTLHYDGDAKPAIPGNQPGPGRTYLGLGYYGARGCRTESSIGSGRRCIKPVMRSAARGLPWPTLPAPRIARPEVGWGATRSPGSTRNQAWHHRCR